MELLLHCGEVYTGILAIGTCFSKRLLRYVGQMRW